MKILEFANYFLRFLKTSFNKTNKFLVVVFMISYKPLAHYLENAHKCYDISGL